jgi:hypothetical protein
MAPPVLQYPLINGHRYSPSSCEFLFQLGTGVMLPIAGTGVKSVTYSPGLDPGVLRGLQPHVMGRTRGTQTDEASLELYMLEFETLRLALSPGGIGFMEVPFNLVVSIFEPPIPGVVGVPPPCLVHTIVGARITKATVNNVATGNEGLSVALDLNVIRVLLGPMAPAVVPSAGMPY